MSTPAKVVHEAKSCEAMNAEANAEGVGIGDGVFKVKPEEVLQVEVAEVQPELIEPKMLKVQAAEMVSKILGKPKTLQFEAGAIVSKLLELEAAEKKPVVVQLEGPGAKGELFQMEMEHALANEEVLNGAADAAVAPLMPRAGNESVQVYSNGAFWESESSNARVRSAGDGFESYVNYFNAVKAAEEREAMESCITSLKTSLFYSLLVTLVGLFYYIVFFSGRKK